MAFPARKNIEAKGTVMVFQVFGEFPRDLLRDFGRVENLF